MPTKKVLGFIKLKASVTSGQQGKECTFQIPNKKSFQVHDIRGYAWSLATSGVYLKYTPLPRFGDPKGANNDIPTLANVEADIIIAGRSLSESNAIPMNMLTGVGDASAGIGTGAVIAENEVVSVKYNNNTNNLAIALDLDCYIILVGEWTIEV